MKYIIILLSLLLFSCEKDNPYPNYGKNSIGYDDNVGDDRTMSIYGTWLLVDAKMYVGRPNGVDRKWYNHFNSSDTIPLRYKSSLRRGGSNYPIEDIHLDTTLWTFKEPIDGESYGQFWLNGDDSKPYGFKASASYTSIIEYGESEPQMGGSARPFTAFIDNFDEKTINITIQQVVDGNYYDNPDYFSILTFKKQ